MEITVGQQGSFNVGSDTYPCTVVAVSPSGHKVTVQVDRVTKYRAWPESYGESFERDESGPLKVFTRRSHGRYLQSGTRYTSLSTGGWCAYMDPHF